MTETLLLLTVCWTAAENDPPLSDLQRFAATRADCRAVIAWQYEHIAWIRSRRNAAMGLAASDPGAVAWWDAWDREVNLSQHSWSLLELAHGASRHPERTTERGRRVYLGRLRKEIGDEDYYRGMMPPRTTIWRLTPRE